MNGEPVKDNVIEDNQTHEDDRPALDHQVVEDDQPVLEGQASKNPFNLIQFMQALFETGLIITGLIAMRQLLPRNLYGDGAVRFQAISELLEKGQLSHMSYSMVGPAFSIPLWLIGSLSRSHSTGFWVAQYNLFVFAASLLALYWLLKDRIDRGLLRKFILILIAASMFANHITSYYGEVFTAACVGVGILAAVTRRSTVGWIAVILGVVNTPASLVGLGLVVLKRMLDTRRWRYILVLFIATAFILAEAWIRRGSPFTTGYETDHGQFSNPFFFGLLSILFSFGKGIFFFAPGLLLPIRSAILRMQHEKKQELYHVYVLWICFLIGLVLVYSGWWAWYGGWFWGPRFFLIASIPASFALAVRLHHRSVSSLALNLLTACVLCLSIWVGIDGAIFGQQGLSMCQANSYAQEPLCHYTLKYSALWHPFFDPLTTINHLASWQSLYMLYCLIVFAYLGLPLLKTLIQQTMAATSNFARGFLNLRSWHF